MDFWDQLLRLDFSGAPRCAWERLGGAFRLIEPALVSAGRLAKRLSCPKCGCNHLLIPEDDEAFFRAVCQCDAQTCGDFRLPRAQVEMWQLNVRKLPDLLGADLPMEPRLFPAGYAPFKAWKLGTIHLRPTGRAGSLVACFSAKDFDLNNAALGASQNDLGPTIFVCRTERAEQLEAILPPDSLVVDFENIWNLTPEGFQAGKSARRILSGWDNDAQPDNSQATRQNGYIFEPRGRKNTKFNNASHAMTTWRCSMDGRTFDLPEVIGSELLVRILLRRGREIYADSLLKSLSGEASNPVNEADLEWLGDAGAEAGSKRHAPDAPDEILGTDDIKRWKDRAKSLQREIEECGDDPGLAGERAKLEEKLDGIIDYLKAATKPGANGTLLPKTFDDTLSKAGNLVGKHLRGVINQLKDIDEELWSHLSNRAILRHGQVCQYDAESGYRWRLR